MAHESDLFDKSFDQQVQMTGGKIEGMNITPNRRIPCEIVLEPMGTGVRVTARDASHRILWGYVASKETVRQIHCPVATYETLQNLVGDMLEKRGLYTPPDAGNPMDSARRALDSLEVTIKKLREVLQVQKVSNATLERARSIAQMATDAEHQITLEAVALKLKT